MAPEREPRARQPRRAALGHTTRYRYDERGRVVSVTRPDGLGTTATY
ncbi:RHS repeat domain-containing protein, partial [Streptomyces sp. NPDC005251]